MRYKLLWCLLALCAKSELRYDENLSELPLTTECTDCATCAKRLRDESELSERKEREKSELSERKDREKPRLRRLRRPTQHHTTPPGAAIQDQPTHMPTTHHACMPGQRCSLEDSLTRSCRPGERAQRLRRRLR